MANFKPTNVRPANGGMGNLVMRILVLGALLVLPAMAGQRGGLDFRWAGAYALAVSAFTYWIYALDKRRAEAGGGRVSELKLHFLELLGGWPGAWLAQRRLRHKCSKVSFQAVFWLIVLSYQLAAFDALRNWQFSRAALERITHSNQAACK